MFDVKVNYLQNKQSDLSIYDALYRENRINMLSEQNSTMNLKLLQITACSIRCSMLCRT